MSCLSFAGLPENLGNKVPTEDDRCINWNRTGLRMFRLSTPRKSLTTAELRLNIRFAQHLAKEAQLGTSLEMN